MRGAPPSAPLNYKSPLNMTHFRESNIKRAFKNLFLRRKANVVMLEPRAGLGDSIICMGLIKELAKRNPDKFFYYACIAPHSYHTISWILNGLENVYPIPVKGGKEAKQLSGFWNCQHWEIGASFVELQRFDASFYEQLNIPFELRWELNQIRPGPRSNELMAKLNPNGEQYILTCNTASSNISFNLNIDNPSNKKIILVNPATNNLCDWVGLMDGAAEIHTIDTSFIHLVESFFYKTIPQPKLFFHLIRPSGTNFTRLLPWNEVVYYNHSEIITDKLYT